MAKDAYVTSPQVYARLGGVLYLATIVFGAFSEGFAMNGYFPKLIGILMQLAGVCYLISSFSELLLPSLADLLGPVILLPPLVGELSYCLWLLIKGVDLARWKERTGAATT